MFDKIRLWWKFDGKYYHKYLIQGIKNLIKWFPIIWKDRDWDSQFIFDILQFKLKNQSKYIGFHDRHTSAKQDAEVMMKCVDLIEKVKTEFYQSEYMDYHESTFDFIDIPENERGDWYEEGMTQLHSELISERFDEYFAKYPEVYDYVINNPDKCVFENKDKQTIAMNMGHELHKRARKELFTLLEENIERWWD
jgi:hypothetical protein